MVEGLVLIRTIQESFYKLVSYSNTYHHAYFLPLTIQLNVNYLKADYYEKVWLANFLSLSSIILIKRGHLIQRTIKLLGNLITDSLYGCVCYFINKTQNIDLQFPNLSNVGVSNKQLCA